MSEVNNQQLSRQEKTDRYTSRRKPVKLILNKNELRVYEMWAKEYYSTAEGLSELIEPGTLAELGGK